MKAGRAILRIWLATLIVSCSPGSTTGPTPAAQSCRLPVLISDITGTNQRAAFLSLPGALIKEATGANGRFYDRVLGRWIAADSQGLSADGLTYVYADGDTQQSQIHVVDLRSGNDRVISTGGPWSVIGFRPEGIYLVKLTYGPYSQAFGSIPTRQGLWLLPSNATLPRQLTADHRSWGAVGPGGVWGTDLNPSDPQPLGGDVGFSNDQVVRLDLKSGAISTWLYRPGLGVSVIGLDGSSVPFVEAQNGARQELWRLVTANPAAPVSSGAWGELGPNGPMVADGPNVWLSGFLPSPPYFAAVYRWSSDAGLKLMARIDDRQILVAGACA